MDQFFLVLNQIEIFLVFIIIGVIAMKCRILNDSTLTGLSKLIMKIILPIYIFIKTAQGATADGLLSSLAVFPIAIIMDIVLFFAAAASKKIFHLTGNRAKITFALYLFGNVGFMGLPLITNIYSDAILYISVFTIVDQVLFWTYGVYLTMPESAGKMKFSPSSLKMLLSPPIIAIVLATAFVLIGIKLPDFLSSALTTTGSCSTPLSLIYVGAVLSKTDIRPVLKCKELYAQIVVKMIAIPAAVFAILHAMGFSGNLAGTMSLLAGLPSISMVAMLSKENGSDGDYSICAVMLTTLVCLVTLPVVSLIISVLS